jgi:hypothetical protein
LGSYRNPDKEYVIITVEEDEFFDDIACNDINDDMPFQRGLYYDGTACEGVYI